MENIVKWFFGFLVAFVFLIALLWVLPAPEAATGRLHPEYRTMLQSGESVADRPATKWMAWLFGWGVIGVFGFVLFIGAYKKNREKRRQIYRALLFGLILYLAVYTSMVVAWWSYHADGSAVWIWGFPTPTAWMLYGLWFAPLFITFIYIFKFNDWILSAEELEVFHKIVAEKRKNK